MSELTERMNTLEQQNIELETANKNMAKDQKEFEQYKDSIGYLKEELN